MPGMAEPDIAIDMVSAASTLSGTSTQRQTHRPRLALRGLGLVGMDAVLTATMAVGSFGLLSSSQRVTAGPVLLALACLSLCTILSFAERGLYAPFEIMSRSVPWRKLTLAWLQAVAVGTLAIFCMASAADYASWPAVLPHMGATLRGSWLPAFLCIGFCGVACGRLVRQKLQVGMSPLNRTAIIGDTASIRELMVRIHTTGRRDFDIVGFAEHADATSDETGSHHERLLELPLLGDIQSLERMIRQDAVDTVLVALPWAESECIQQIVRRISMSPVDVYIYPGANLLAAPLHRENGSFDDLPLVMACNRPIDGWRGVVKRCEDVVLSAGVLLFLSPILLMIAMAVKTTSKGPVFFRQRRLGYNNRVIEVLKFRSMYTHLADADASQQALRGDKRVTRLGAWLRRTSLDELPQLLNVLRGDMSLVGPRPHALATTAGGIALEEAVPVYASRHRVKPGITGWAQVHGHRGALDSVDKIVHRVNHDLFYIENWSLGLDLKILWRTIRLVFADDNAF
jgi:polysaccharide biosynthesis protein PslA